MKPAAPFEGSSVYESGIAASPSVKDLGIASGHPTDKIAEQCEGVMRHLPGDVYDPFLGSGTTLIACERLGRRCRAVEISPGYCAVTIQRWVDMTGKEPLLLEVQVDSR